MMKVVAPMAGITDSELFGDRADDAVGIEVQRDVP